MEIGHRTGVMSNCDRKRRFFIPCGWKMCFFPGALIEYAVILFKKQKEQKEPKKEAAVHRSSGNISRIYSPGCKIWEFITKDYVSPKNHHWWIPITNLPTKTRKINPGSNGRLCRLESPQSDENMELVLPRINGCKVVIIRIYNESSLMMCLLEFLYSSQLSSLTNK